MAIETSSTSMAVTSSSGVNQNSTSVSSKSSSDTSFKDEMDKVSSTENKDVKEAKNDTEKTVKETDTKNKKSETTEKTNKKDDNKDNKDLLLMDKIGFEDNKISFNDVNRMLVDDIQQMADIYGKFSDWNCSCADNKFTLSMNETDAQFFINLTNNYFLPSFNFFPPSWSCRKLGAPGEGGGGRGWGRGHPLSLPDPLAPQGAGGMREQELR